mgnify:CR=1 FL=1
MNRPITATSFAIHEIKRLIVERTLEPGQKIDQACLAERLNLSRLPIRQALTHLAEQNFIQLRDHKSAIVTPVSGRDMRDLYALRCQLERWGLEQSFLAFSEELIATLEGLLGETERCVETDDHAKFMEFNRQFHFALYAVIDNPYTIASIKNLFDLSERYHWMCTSAPGMMEISHAEHREMVDLIRRRDLDGFLGLSERHNCKTIEWVQEHGTIDVAE